MKKASAVSERGEMVVGFFVDPDIIGKDTRAKQRKKS